MANLSLYYTASYLRLIFFSLIGLSKIQGQEVPVTDPPPIGTNSQAKTSAETAAFALDLSKQITALSAAFQQEQAVLDQAEEALIDSGATSDQLNLWEEQHAKDFAAQDARISLKAAYVAFQPEEYVIEIGIPDNASPKCEDYLVTRAMTLNSLSQVHNEIFQCDVVSITPQLAQERKKKEEDRFSTEHASEIETMREKAQLLSEELAHRPWEVSAPLSLPPGVSAPTAAYLTLRDDLQRAEVEVHNRYCAGDLKVLNQQMALWSQQHEALYLKLQQLAIQLPSSNPTPSDEN